jgi:hypothetical protein
MGESIRKRQDRSKIPKFARSSFLVSECAFKSESLVNFLPGNSVIAWLHRTNVNAPRGFQVLTSDCLHVLRALVKTIFKSKLTLIKTNRGAHHESAIP